MKNINKQYFADWIARKNERKANIKKKIFIHSLLLFTYETNPLLYNIS